jgi:hypothetical protein
MQQPLSFSNTRAITSKGKNMASKFYKPVFLRKTKDPSKARCQFSRVYTDIFFELSKLYSVDHGEFMEFYPQSLSVVPDAITFSLSLDSNTFYFNITRTGELSIYKAGTENKAPSKRYEAIYPESYNRLLLSEWFHEQVKTILKNGD